MNKMKDFIELHDANRNNQAIIIGIRWIATIENIDSEKGTVRLGIIRDKGDGNIRFYEIIVNETYDEIRRLLMEE